MNNISKLAFAVLVLLGSRNVLPAQTPQPAGTLVIAGQQEQVPLLRLRGRSYVDVDSLARIMHGSVSFQGGQIVLTLPAGLASSTAPSASVRPQPQLSANYLSAQVEALAQIREWRAALIKAVQTNSAVADSWVSPLRRNAEAKLQLAAAATSTDPDQQASALLRNEFTAMQQMSDQFVAVHAQASYTSPDSFENNPQDQKIVACEQGLASMASSKQFQDLTACH